MKRATEEIFNQIDRTSDAVFYHNFLMELEVQEELRDWIVLAYTYACGFRNREIEIFSGLARRVPRILYFHSQTDEELEGEDSVPADREIIRKIGDERLECAIRYVDGWRGWK